MFELTFDDAIETQIVGKLSNEDYHAHKALGSSGVKQLLDNPHVFLAGIKRPQTDAMRMGSAVHKLVLEHNEFHDEYVVAPEFNARTNEGKALRAKFEQMHAGKTALKADEYATALKCKEAVDAVIHPFMKTGKAEQSFFAKMDDIDVKCRPDWYNEDLGIIVDLKVVQDASADGFIKAVGNFGYYIQAAFYMDVMRLNGHNISKFVFCAVEKTAPYMVGLYELSPEALDFGRSEYNRGLDIFKRLDEYKKPVYKDMKTGDVVQTITLPSFVYFKNGASL